jgi:hypothetical protein
MTASYQFGLPRKLVFVSLIAGICGLTTARATVVVNSLEDLESPPAGMITLRSALEQATANEPIIFAPHLDAGVITLSIVAEEHTALVGEVMGFDDDHNISYLVGYFERDYGRSALFARKDVVIDASALSNGVTIAWAASNTNDARVLAVYGDLTLRNVSITGGRSVSHTNVVAVGGHDQTTTRARGGGLAIWGVAKLENCRLFDNSCISTILDPARDAGIFGGGIYADIVEVSDCIISGNSLSGTGVSGGGVFAVGGADSSEPTSTIERSVITGNRIDGIFAYGGGVYSDGGGIGNLKTLELENCTIAENWVGVSGPSFLYGSGYWRGGGVYMSNGHLAIRNCTIVLNQVHGVPRTNELSKPNMAGGIAATIGNAHAVESMTIGKSIIAGNTVHESTGGVYEQDIFTGSLFSFISEGHNRLGVLDFSQILVPIGELGWASLCRKHYPKLGDLDGVNITNILDLAEGIIYSPDILSVGVNASNSVPILYAPQGSAVDQVPVDPYSLQKVHAQYELEPTSNNFLEIMLGRLEQHYGITNFANTFTADFETFLATADTDDTTEGNQPHLNPADTPILTLADSLWFGPSQIWPSKIFNYPYIEFWHRLDLALQNENIPGMGPELLGDDAWLALFDSGPLDENTSITFILTTENYSADPATVDQNGTARPLNSLSNIGAIESPPLIVPPPQFDSIEVDGTHLVLRWNGHPNRSYTLWATPSLSQVNWSLIVSGVTNNAPVIIQPASSPHDGQFFKLELEPLE